jgi:hypothetical protein
MTQSASIRFNASPDTIERTDIASYEVRDDGRAWARNAQGENILEIKTTHRGKENTFYLKGPSGYVDLKYQTEIELNFVDVRGEANGKPLHIRVRREYPTIITSEGVPELRDPLKSQALSMLNDVEHYSSALARGAIADADGRTIVFSTGHFVTCALASVETGISITFGHPLGIVFGALGLIACAIWA